MPTSKQIQRTCLMVKRLIATSPELDRLKMAHAIYRALVDGFNQPAPPYKNRANPFAGTCMI